MKIMEIGDDYAVRLEDLPELRLAAELVREKYGPDDPLLKPVEAGHEGEAPPTLISCAQIALREWVHEAQEDREDCSIIVMLPDNETGLLHLEPAVPQSFFVGKEAVKIARVLFEVAEVDPNHPQHEVAERVLDSGFKSMLEVPAVKPITAAA